MEQDRTYVFSSASEFEDSDKYIGNSERDRLLCPVRAIREYLRRTRDCLSTCSCLFVTVPEPQCVVHPHTVSYWICQVIQRAHEDVPEEDMRLVRYLDTFTLDPVVSALRVCSVWGSGSLDCSRGEICDALTPLDASAAPTSGYGLRLIKEIPSVLSAGRLQMKDEKSGAPTYRPAAQLSGTQFEIASGAQFENAVEPNCV
ncbi:hypothetical protein E2C01_027776 [Portunus trituberculatus]|uniref:Uncharacterized protein n=1 Tax=Portunus trituberculatus TaxID=210409 RepID=A0A5B7EMJ5_PORTR|nr:hypothetical protein [Portunus trituberculatus]